MLVRVAFSILIFGIMFPGSVGAASGLTLSPAMTRLGDQVALDVAIEYDGVNQITTGPALLITPSLLPEPTVFGWQLGWHHAFLPSGRFRPYLHPEYQLIFFRPGLMHTLRWQYGVEVTVTEHWWVGQSLGVGLVREHVGDFREWAFDGIFRISVGYRF